MYWTDTHEAHDPHMQMITMTKSHKSKRTQDNFGVANDEFNKSTTPRLKKPDAQKSAKGPRALGAGFEAKARAFRCDMHFY